MTPSEKIKQLVNKITPSENARVEIWVQCILYYLDEQAEKGKVGE